MNEAASVSSDQGNLYRHDQLVDDRLVCWYFLAALAYLTISLVGGFLMALQLVHMNPLRDLELFSAGRWRMIHSTSNRRRVVRSKILMRQRHSA